MRHIVKYTTTDGLSSYNIRKIIKDKNEYLWISTQYGLSRFDGKQFVNFSKNTYPDYQLYGVDIQGLIEDSSSKMIWVLPGEHGFNGISQITYLTTKKRQIEYRNAEEFGMSMEYTYGRLWMGSSTCLRIFNIAENKFDKNPEYPSCLNNSHNIEARSLFVDLNGNLWCFYSWYGIVIYDGKTAKKIKEYPLQKFKDIVHSGNIVVNKCISYNRSALLLATSQGLRKIKFDNEYNIQIDNSPFKLSLDLNTTSIETVHQTLKGTVFIASHDQLFMVDSTLSKYTILKESDNSEGDWLGSVHDIFVDDKDNVWLGCQQGLALIPGSPQPFQSAYFDKITRNTLDHVRGICVLDNGDILAGLRNGIAYIRERDRGISIVDKTQLYHHVYQDKMGKIHVVTQNGMKIYANHMLMPVKNYYPELSKYSLYPVNSHLFLGDSIVVLGTENEKGILIWNYKKHTVREIDNSSNLALASGIVNNIFLDKKGRLWILSDHVVSIISSGFSKIQPLVLHDSVSHQEINLLFDMCEANGSYWIAAYGTGIIELDSSLKVKRIINTVSGLSDNGVYQIFPTPKGLVITSDNGLTLFNPEENSFKRYYQADGLHSNSFEEVCGVMKNGLIYAGGVKGFTIIDPSKFTTNTIPPKTYINRVLIERADNAAKIDTTNIELKQLEVPSDALQVSLYFSGINYSNADRTTFAYRIKEHDKNWVNIGTQNYINLIGLPPGTYQLEVRAANEDNVWSKPVALTLVYLPKWYQTWTFKIALVLLALGLGYLGYRIRISQILKQQKIRRDVASDLHDDIGSSLNSVKVFAHLAKANPAEQDYIANIEDNLEQATVGLRDMIWVLDDNRDSVADLCNRLSQYAAKPAEAIGIEVHMITDGVGDMNLPKTAKRNLFLIAKECINNCVKYAGCKNVWLTVRLQSKKLVFVVKDDGCGFDEGKITEGYGLTNIRNRAEQIGFSCTIVSGATGTEITITEK